MRLIRVDLPSHLEHVNLVSVGDLHIGDLLHHGPAIQKAVNWIASTPEQYVVLMGDILNYATKSGKSDGAKDMPIEEQYLLAQSVLGPIVDRIIVLIQGNHEYRAVRENQLPPAFALADKLGIRYADAGAYIHLSFGRRKKGGKRHYTAYATHGWGGGRTAGAKVNSLESLAKRINADIYLMAHHHEVHSFDWDTIDYDPYHQKITRRQKVGLISGAWLDWGGYAERLGYPPSAIRLPYVALSAWHRDMAVQTYRELLRG